MNEHKKFLTPQDIENTIVATRYDRPAVGNGTMTVCYLTLKNGTVVTGINYGAIDPVRHDWEKGAEIAREQAIEKIWELEGYLLRQRLYEAKEKAKTSLSTLSPEAQLALTHNLAINEEDLISLHKENPKEMKASVALPDFPKSTLHLESEDPKANENK